MVSIVIINYNDKLRVGRAIESAIHQSWKETEVIVVDDGSDAETRVIYMGYTGKIRLIQLERDDETARTPSRARNAGIDAANGEWICFLDSDNYYSTDFVESLIKYDGDVNFCNWEIIGLQKYAVNIEKVWELDKIMLENYLKYQHLDHQCLLIKKAYLDKVGKYDERLPRSQDCDMIVRLVLNGGVFNHVPKCLFHFEKHEADQVKHLASVHGKTLWTLKNGLSITWLLGLIKSPQAMMAVNRGIWDFCYDPIWAEEYIKSGFKEVLGSVLSQLGQEIRENAPVDAIR